MKGIRMFRPGVSVPWYLPRRSTTQAFCCGTTLSARKPKMTAMMIRTIPMDVMLGSPLCVCSDLLDHEPAAADLAHAVRTGPARNAAGGDCRPHRAAVAN